MQKTRDIRIEEFNYPLPDERIAKFPLSQRDRSKLLLYRSGSVSESEFFHFLFLLKVYFLGGISIPEHIIYYLFYLRQGT